MGYIHVIMYVASKILGWGVIVCMYRISYYTFWFLEASLELFGSSANQFGHCNSDMDLCLLMNEKYQVGVV